MSTATTLPIVQNQLVKLFTAALSHAGWDRDAVPVYYTFPGATRDRAQVFFGRIPESTLPPTLTARSVVPNITVGRKQREETYPLEATVIVEKGDANEASAVAVDGKAFAILGLLDGVLADDPGLALGGTPPVIQYATLIGYERVGGGPYVSDGGGYATQLVALFEVNARLT